MNRVLLLFFCLIGILLSSKATIQAQPCQDLYKYDTLIIGVAGVEMTLTASWLTTHTVTNDMAAWAAVTQTENQIKVKVAESNETDIVRIGHINVKHGTCNETIVFLQPGRTCQPGIESTAGKRFWVSFPENINTLTYKLELVATANELASGTITNPNTGYSSTFTVPANSTTSLPPTTTVLYTQAYNEDGEEVRNKALYVETGKNISLYAYNYQPMSSDAANILPIGALGDEYYTLSYNSNIANYISGSTHPATPEEFLIVATENNTLVTIVPTATTEKGRLEGDPFLIKLKKGQTYLVKAGLSGTIINGNLYKSITGTYIKANKSIAVFSGHKRAQIDCINSSRDNLYDQLRPIRIWGLRYAVISTGQPKDLYRILAVTDGTVVKINGVAQPPFSRTEYRDYKVSDGEFAFIESNYPISVGQFGISLGCDEVSTGDPYLMLLNPVENQIMDVTFTPFPSEAIHQHSVAIVVNKENKSFTKLINKTTGDTVELDFMDMSGHNYSYAVTDISPVTHSIHNDKGFIAFAFGYGGMESYAYSVGARFNALLPPDVQLDTTYCIGAIPVQFPASFENGDYKWYISEDDEVGSATPPIISTSVPGTYTYYLSQVVGCSESPRKKVEIVVRPLPKINFNTDLSAICNTPYPFAMALPAGGSYTCPLGCVGGNFIPRNAGVGTHNITYTYADEYGCGSSADTVITVLEIVGNPKIEAIGSTTFCAGDSVVLNAIDATIVDAVYFQWLRNGDIIVGATTTSYAAKESGTYTLAIRSIDNCASDSASNPIVVYVRGISLAPTIHATPAPPYFYGVDYSLNIYPTQAGVIYNWYKDDVFLGAYGISYFISLLKDSDSGIYYVEAIDDYCTERSPEFLLAPIVMPELFIPNIFTPNGDGINDKFRIGGIAAFPENTLTVINKRGKLVYSKKNYDNSWDGEGQPDDIYYYYFTAVSFEGVTTTHRGYVYIKRKK